MFGGAIALVILIASSMGYSYFQSQEVDVRELMGKAAQAYLKVNYEEVLTGSDVYFTVEFRQIINNYNMTDALI